MDDLRQYFGRFGRILDVYIPKVISMLIIEVVSVNLTD